VTQAEPGLRTLDHVIVAVRELDAAAAAYQTLLGREPSWRGAHPAWGTANVLFRMANTYLELVAPSGEGAFATELSRRLARDGEGLTGMAFGTDDADACAAALRARGLPASDPQPGSGRDEASGRERRWRNVWLPRGPARGVLLFAIEHLSPSDALPPAALRVERDAAVEALDHVVVESADLEASRTLYGDALGVRLALDRRFEARGLRILFFRVGGVTLELVGRLEPPPERAEGADTDRLSGLAWRTPDVDAARARLAAAGVDVSEVRPGRKPGTRVCTVRSGTCGVATLLIGPGPA